MAVDGENAFLHRLETTVHAELEPADEGARYVDPEEELHDEVALRSLLGAIEELENSGKNDKAEKSEKSGGGSTG